MSCRVPNCTAPVHIKRWNLCFYHYDRAQDRRRRTGITWEQILNHPVLLQRRRTFAKKVLPNTKHLQTLQVRSCLTCEHLRVELPRFFRCDRNAWPDGVRLLAVATVDRNGLPPAIAGYGQLCKKYEGFPDNLEPRAKPKEWSREPVE